MVVDRYHDRATVVFWEIEMRLIQLAILILFTSTLWAADSKYRDGRPAATLRMDAKDHGIVLRYGDGPDQCDILGARDVWVFEADGTYYMHYDAAGPKGWLCSLAVSTDLITWEKKGPILEFGNPGEDDSRSASYGVTYFDGDQWHMFYLGTPNVSAPPDLVPSFPYLTMKARAASPAGPWVKQKDVVPFRTRAGTYYSITASPGQVIQHGEGYRRRYTALVLLETVAWAAKGTGPGVGMADQVLAGAADHVEGDD